MSRVNGPRAHGWGAAAGLAVAGLCGLYAGVLAIGLATLPSPQHPIQDPWFTLMELLILAIAPAMLIFTLGLHAWVPVDRKPAALAGVLFMGLCAGTTCIVHFSVMTLSRHPAFVPVESAPLWFSFTWPSVAYALDILAWDYFFTLSAAFCALALRGITGTRVVRILLHGSAILALLGLLGIPLESMEVRNIGIIGYVVLFPIAAALVARRLRRASEADGVG